MKLGGLAMVPLRVRDVIELARTCKLEGRPAIEDPLVRDQLVGFAIEERAMALCEVRARHEALTRERPFATMMMRKLTFTEYRRRLSAFAVSREREDGTLDIILSTPIQPGPYIAGKLRGLIQYLMPMILVPTLTMLIIAVFVWRCFGKTSPATKHLFSTKSGSWLARLWLSWFLVLLAIPVALAVAAMLG